MNDDLGRPGDITVGTGRCIKETDKAILVELETLNVMLEDLKLWVPKSQLSDDSEVYGENDEGQLLVTQWWARKQGWV